MKQFDTLLYIADYRMQSALHNIKMWEKKKTMCLRNEEIKNRENSETEFYL